MSKQVRRIAMSLAALTLLTSLVLAAQAFLDPPDEALAACQVEVTCYGWCTIGSPFICQCSTGRYQECRCQWCSKINLDCTVTYFWDCPYCYFSGCCCTCPE